MWTKLQEWAREDTVDETRLAIAFEPATLQLYGRFIDRLTRAAGRPGRLLDVGCATGAFMVAARDHGWTVEGLELGQASSAFARERHGLEVTQGSIYDFAPAEPFDAIACLEVIEHLPQPIEALRRLRSWLKPGGALLLSTPNFDALIRRLHGPKWWVINCEDEHIVLFNAATLTRALIRAGFTLDWLDTRSIDYAGIAALYRGGRPTPSGQARAPAQGEEATHGYYAARDRKSALKAGLERAGLLSAARGALRAQDWLTSTRGSPLWGLGEQIVLLARRAEEPA